MLRVHGKETFESCCTFVYMHVSRFFSIEHFRSPKHVQTAGVFVWRMGALINMLAHLRLNDAALPGTTPPHGRSWHNC